MEQQSKYKTRQREILLDYLKTVPGKHVTASDLYEHFRQEGVSIGLSTVYRQLEYFVTEGIVNRYIIDAGSPVCYEYNEPDAHADAEPCFHLKCERCNRLIHLKCDELAQIQAHMLKEHRFSLDAARTVFYGLCDECMQQ